MPPMRSRSPSLNLAMQPCSHAAMWLHAVRRLYPLRCLVFPSAQVVFSQTLEHRCNVALCSVPHTRDSPTCRVMWELDTASPQALRPPFAVGTEDEPMWQKGGELSSRITARSSRLRFEPSPSPTVDDDEVWRGHICCCGAGGGKPCSLSGRGAHDPRLHPGRRAIRRECCGRTCFPGPDVCRAPRSRQRNNPAIPSRHAPRGGPVGYCE